MMKCSWLSYHLGSALLKGWTGHRVDGVCIVLCGFGCYASKLNPHYLTVTYLTT